MGLQDFRGLIEDGGITGANVRFVEIEMDAAQHQLLMMHFGRRRRWRHHNNRSRCGRRRRRRRNQRVADFVADDGSHDSADHSTTTDTTGQVSRIGMRFVEFLDSISSRGSETGSDQAAYQPAAVPSALRRICGGASGDGDGEHKRDAGHKGAVSMRQSRFHGIAFSSRCVRVKSKKPVFARSVPVGEFHRNKVRLTQHYEINKSSSLTSGHDRYWRPAIACSY